MSASEALKHYFVQSFSPMGSLLKIALSKCVVCTFLNENLIHFCLCLAPYSLADLDIKEEVQQTAINTFRSGIHEYITECHQRKVEAYRSTVVHKVNE